MWVRLMRRRISREGLVIVALGGKGQVKIDSVGLPLDEDYAAFVAEAEADVTAAIGKLKGGARDREGLIEAARLAARRAATRWSGKRPQVRVMLVEG